LSENIEKCNDALDRLASIIELRENGSVAYNLPKGEAFGTKMIHDNDLVGVRQIFAKKGSIGPWTHYGKAIAYIIVYEGKGRAEFKGNRENEEIGIGESIVIPTGQVHRSVVLEDMSVVVVTVPAMKGYPDERR